MSRSIHCVESSQTLSRRYGAFLCICYVINVQNYASCKIGRQALTEAELRALCHACSPPRMSREQLAVERARRAFSTGRSKPLAYRIRQLNNLRRFLVERQSEIAEAAKKDLNRVGEVSLYSSCQYAKQSNPNMDVSFHVKQD